MLGRRPAMTEIEVAEMKEALYDQYMMMTNLCIELEEEREASATAASEALSMILRLQREKAAEQMDASHYKRMAEEKIEHVEENMAELEDDLQEKEMEISFLRHQLEDYWQKLSFVGVTVSGFDEQREARGEIDSESPNFIRRNTSLPIFRYGKIRDVLANGPMSPLAQKRLSRYLSQIDDVESVKASKLGMLSEQTDESNMSCESTARCETILTESKGSNSSVSELDLNRVVIHDVFEVPECESSCSKITTEPKNENVLTSTESLLIPQADSWPEKGNHSKASCKDLRDSSSSSENDLDQIKKRLEKLEKDKIMRQSSTSSSEQHLKLLKDIYDQLTTIENRIKGTEPQKSCTRRDDSTLNSVIEALLSFSI